MKINLKLFGIVAMCVFTASSILLPTTFSAGTKEDLDAINKKLEIIRIEKNEANKKLQQEQGNQNAINNELSKLSSEIAVFETEILETELEISQLDLQIQLVTEEIQKTEQVIVKSADEIDLLSQEANDILVDMYMDYKLNTKYQQMINSSAGDFLRNEIYQETLNDENTQLLNILSIKKADLQEQKEKLTESKIAVQRDQTLLTEKRKQLESSKISLDSQRQIYVKKRDESFANAARQKELLNSITKQEQQVLAEQTRIEQEYLNSIKDIPNGTYVTAGTIVGNQGCTGRCTGPHLHFAVQNNGVTKNPCDYLGQGGKCGGSGNLSQPMRGTYYLTSGYGPRWGTFHYGIDLANVVSDAPIYATHSGYMLRSFVPCNKGDSLCKAGGANVVTICENRNCNVGIKTQYWHLR